MNWSTTPPTTSGYYLWSQRIDMPEEVIKVYPVALGAILVCSKGREDDEDNKYTPADLGGFWLRLVPAEEVEKAFQGGYRYGQSGLQDMEFCWNESRAKQIAEGTL